MRKEAEFRLPIALGILGANGDLGNIGGFTDTMSVVSFHSTAASGPSEARFDCAASPRDGFYKFLLPEENATEAGVVSGLRVYLIFFLSQAGLFI